MHLINFYSLPCTKLHIMPKSCLICTLNLECPISVKCSFIMVFSFILVWPRYVTLHSPHIKKYPRFFKFI